MLTVRKRQRGWQMGFVLIAVMPCAAWGQAAIEAFASENAIAMDQMMARMSVPLTGDVDRDFSTLMIAHHQGAIDMAQAELRYGHNEQLRRIAQGIVIQQQQEIAAMRLAVGSPAVASPEARRYAPN